MNTEDNQVFLFEGLLLKRYQDQLVVVSDETDRKKASNETFRNKDVLRAAGFRWNAALNSWTIDKSRLSLAQEILQRINRTPLEKFIDKVEELPEFVRHTDNLSKKEELAQKIEGFVEELSTAVDAAASSAAVKKFLEFNMRFRGYSWYNTLLIYLQRKDATKVAGFRQWEEKFHRRVKKGAKGISILAPITSKRPESGEEDSGTSPVPAIGGGSTSPDTTTPEDDKTKKYLRFIAVYVFDVSDTEPIDEKGELPVTPAWHGSNDPNEKAEELYRAAVEVAEGMNIKTTQDAATGGEQGWTSGDHINISSPVAGVNRAATVIHEIAHSLLHFKETSPFYIGDEEGVEITKELKELQAESVSYVVIKYYGLPAEHQATYLALWKGNKDAVRRNLTVIKKAADFIISEIDKVREEKQKTATQTNESQPMFEHLGGNRFKLNS